MAQQGLSRRETSPGGLDWRTPSRSVDGNEQCDAKHEATHRIPLMRTLDTLRKADARVHEIVLASLGVDDVGGLVADG
jgi:hypothetical protein